MYDNISIIIIHYNHGIFMEKFHFCWGNNNIQNAWACLHMGIDLGTDPGWVAVTCCYYCKVVPQFVG